MTTSKMNDYIHLQLLLDNNQNDTKFADAKNQEQTELLSINIETHKPPEEVKSSDVYHFMETHQNLLPSVTHKGKKIAASSIEFIIPRESDDVDCKSKDHNATDCNTMKRIIFLLKYYEQQQQALKNNSINSMPIYDYVSSLENYDVPTLMDDWYRCKKNHLKGKDDRDWIINIMKNGCDNMQKCGYVGRYQRERDKETLVNLVSQTPHKDVILMDQLDPCIHSFSIQLQCLEPINIHPLLLLKLQTMRKMKEN
eukprot:225322_1